MNIPRPEYPRPQFERKQWLCLNGEWSYEFDHGKSGRDRGLSASRGFADRIVVPFAPESSLSGVGHTDFIEMMWYHRTVTVPKEWAGKHTIIHFGGVDYECELFVDGVSAGRHWGGTSSFQFDLTGHVRPGESQDFVLWVRDELRSGMQGGGKQCPDYASRACHYTRTTGIWQTVWLEAVHAHALRDVRIVPDLDAAAFTFTPRYYGIGKEMRFAVEVRDGAKVVASGSAAASLGTAVTVTLEDPKVWEPGSPFLYDITFTVTEQGKPIDSVAGYAGLRKIHIEADRVFLNNKPFYQRLVLDQGFYPDGIWTAPSDEALKHDIELSFAAGFNGARLHQKVFEERFHYWADRLGYLTWGESSSWGLQFWEPAATRNFLREWSEIVVRDRNHPSIVAWSPFNESRSHAENPQHGRTERDAYELTHALDGTRPVNDSSGYIHYITDLWTVHSYEQDPQLLKEKLTPRPEEGVFRNFPEFDSEYTGQPYIIDEFGGIKWDPATQTEAQDGVRTTSWGYGQAPKNIEEFYARLEGLVRTVVTMPHICGFCYTQLTDVEQEQNGVYFYDRSEKFDMDRVRSIFTMKR